MDKNFIKLDYDKIRKLLDLAKEEKLDIVKKNKKKVSLRKKNVILKNLERTKKTKIKSTKDKIKKNMKSSDILKINTKLINDLKKIEDIEDSITSIDDDIIKTYPVDYFGLNLSSTESESEAFIESFGN